MLLCILNGVFICQIGILSLLNVVSKFGKNRARMMSF